MSKIQDSVCPLCKSSAKIQHHPMKHSSHYTCPSCGELVIKQSAESRLHETTAEIRQRFSEAAKKCSEGNVFFISRSDDNAATVTGKCLPLAEALRR